MYKIAVVQLNLNDVPENNLKKCLSWVRDAANQGADVICLPELYSSHYFCQSEDTDMFALAEPLYGVSFNAFSAVAKELGVVIIVPFFEKRMAGIYHNSAYIINSDGTNAGLYRKMHIPDDPHFYEKFYFTPGDTGFKTFSTEKAKIGTLICWDQWYPEAARLTALRGAEILFYPTAIGWLPSEKAARGASQKEAWELVQRSHAVANGCYTVAVNRVGFEPAPEPSEEEGIEFWGGTFVAGPDGVILVRAPENEEAILVQEIDLDRIDALRTEWPFLRDRRIDAYDDLSRRYIDDE